MTVERPTDPPRWRPPTRELTAVVDIAGVEKPQGRLQLTLIGLVVAGGLMASLVVWQQRSSESAEQQTNPTSDTGAR